MTTRSLLAIIGRRWYILLVGVAAAGVAFLMLRSDGAYTTQARVAFVSPGISDVGQTDDGQLDISNIDELITPATKVVAFTWVSNMLGTINPVAELCRRAHEVGAIVVVDASQVIITCSTTQATNNQITLIQRLSRKLLVNALARPKLRAKAPITALIAPLAPIIGVAPCGSIAHCAPAAA